MDFENASREIARTLVDAFDVDVQLWMGRALVRLRETQTGTSFAEWAEANPLVFESALRVTSAMVRRLPEDGDLLVETVYTQLSRLPVEVKRAVEDGATHPGSRRGADTDLFRERFEEAVSTLSDDELARVVRLNTHQLQEWVDSPLRLRPHLLKKWTEEETERRERSEHTRVALRDSIASVPDKLDTAAGQLATQLRKVNDWLEARQKERPGSTSRKPK